MRHLDSLLVLWLLPVFGHFLRPLLSLPNLQDFMEVTGDMPSSPLQLDFLWAPYSSTQLTKSSRILE